MDKPSWYPVRTDHDWCDRIRKDTPDVADKDDDTIRDIFAYGTKYTDNWDHLGDARCAYGELADAYLKLEQELIQANNLLLLATKVIPQEEDECVQIGHGPGCDCARSKQNADQIDANKSLVSDIYKHLKIVKVTKG